MKKECFLLGALLFLVLACEAGRSRPDPRESVVLVHGLGRTEHSMIVLAQRLRWAGYDVATMSYDSRSASLSEHVGDLDAAVALCCREAHQIHFVGHSLGGIVIRRYLAEMPPATLGRVVLMAPPNRGSELAEWLLDFPLGARALGPAGRALGPDSMDLPEKLAPPAYPMGIIAGNRSVNPIGSAMIPGPDDGIVAVDRARIADVPTVVLPRSHTFIMNSRHAADATIHFLRTGTFEEQEDPLKEPTGNEWRDTVGQER